MTMVLDDGVLGGRMALRTGGIARKPHLLGMRVVAVAAGDAGLVHLALAEGPPDEHLVLLLAIGMVEALAQRHRQEMVEQAIAGTPAFGELAAPRVAACAGLHLVVGGARRAAARVARGGVDDPRDIAAFVEGDRQAMRSAGCASLVAALAAALAAAHGSHMRRTGSVAGLAADRHLGVAGVVGTFGVVVALADIRRVAVRAHEVPVLRALRPVQFVAMVEHFFGVLAEPALSAGLFRPRVPGDRHRLQAAARQLDEVLLLRLHTECVPHLEVGELAVGSVGTDEELAVALEELRGDAVAGVGRAREIAQHGLRCGVLHGALVLRALPGRMLSAVAVRAGGAADEGRGGAQRGEVGRGGDAARVRDAVTPRREPPPRARCQREHEDTDRDEQRRPGAGLSAWGRDRRRSSRS